MAYDSPSESLGKEPVDQVVAPPPVDPQTSPDTPISPPAQRTSESGVEGAIHAVENKIDRTQLWMVRLTAAIAFFAFCSVCVGVLQWNAMRGQLGEMKSTSGQTDELIKKTGILASNAGVQADRTKDLADRMKEQADRTKVIADEAVVSAEAAKSAALTSEKAMTVGNRPWVKVTHKIIQPLTFGLPRSGPADVATFEFFGAKEPVASMRIEDTFENVGQTIALNVLTWEDVFAEDYETPVTGDHYPFPTTRSATARQQDWCGTNRNSQQSRERGHMLFPHTPMRQISGMATLMSKVHEAVAKSPIKGKASFVVVGCVCYRSSFEDPRAPNHQTRFMYRLGVPQDFGWYPYVEPQGIANNLQLIESIGAFTAD